jgi:PAS domain S-box-containing protein
MLHRLVERQLKKLGLDEATPPTAEGWQQFLERVSQSYIEADRERYLLERSLTVSSREMQELYESLQQSSEMRLAEVRAINEKLQNEIIERKQAEADLMDSEARYRAIATTVPGVIYQFTSRNGVWAVDYVAPQTFELFGLNAEDVLQDLNNFIKHIYPDDLPSFMVSVTEAVEKLTPWNYEGRLTNPRTGELIWWQGMSSPVATTSGEIIFNGILLNITERKRVEVQLALAHDQALEASRLKSQLLAKVSHELRTPLNVILGFAEMLDIGVYGALPAEQRRLIVEIIDSTHYLTELVNELLDQAQLDAGKLKLNIKTFALADLIDGILSKMDVLAKTKGLTLTTDIAADVPGILSGDSARLQQILVNLVSNAIKFTQTGGVRVCLYRPDPAHWAMQVSDTGPGIPVEAQSYIFEPFRQVDGSITRVHAGAGLGLSIVKQLTILMGGQITLESEVGRGSTFTVQLPLTPA